ncbi:type 1 glutamine amidotransferase domain-containing protein [Allobranchiibius sp. GilTou73]|uniref:type 1 glutamine amidotransferase domain-containing protein n=1 Tax=Allobranchiibius sp. GilTou73 TaxID=2904523 RepID=UPI001F3985A3|nr:type 1 glutamine amidotransferase domain-containing protein [Allobranchiibius sp. GilTou73]UIJ35737.1 type 1 glutamine amidotransferase [Allobranchiibius sp. GilTou73]
MAGIEGKKVLAIVTNYGIEQDELVVPVEKLKEAGAKVTIAAVEKDTIKTLVGDKDPGKDVEADIALSDADASDYDALLIAGGTINADTLRTEEKATDLVKAFTGAGKIIAAICHAPWVLVEAGVLQGKTLTSFASVQTDVRNAGGSWVDESVKVCPTAGWTLITSRDPDDLGDFVPAIVDALG